MSCIVGARVVLLVAAVMGTESLSVVLPLKGLVLEALLVVVCCYSRCCDVS